MPGPTPDVTLVEGAPEEAATAGLPPVAVTVAVEAGAAGGEGKRGRLGFGGWLAAAWLVLLLAACVLAPVLPIPGPNEPIDGLSEQQPLCFEPECVAGHPLGGDSTNRDMASRLVYGARNSLFVGVGAVAMGTQIGGTLGLLAGYARGRLDAAVVALLDAMLSLPAIVFTLAFTVFFEERVRDALFHSRETAGRVTLTLALGIIAIPILARITRANTLTWSEREFVVAARAQGARSTRIMVREVLPNVAPAMAATALLAIAVVIIAEAAVSILGVGIDLPAPTWGNIIFEGFPELTNKDAPHIVLEVSIVMFVTILALNYLGDAVRARFDVREAKL